MKRIAALTLILLAGKVGLHGQNQSDQPIPETVQFNRDVRPILSDNCFQCHGPDKATRKAGLRLDTETGSREEIDGRHAVVEGKPELSELIARITTSDEDDKMPPVKSGRKLSQRDISVLRRWIEQGAKYESHWAFIKPSRPKVPSVKNEAWIKNGIDRFILSRLEAEGLQPSPEADKRTLLRRLSFDLTGLPPALEDFEQFTKDNSPQGYEIAVNRFVSSPHYGERMAAHWLDLVRYADTDGFHADNYRSVYPYRDYVINAFNQNMPFDQFTREQIAGDLIPENKLAQKIASTYNRLNRTTEEGGAQAKEYLAKYVADRVRTTASVWMGATMGCAECHDHKFDPYTLKDFYSFGAFFADIKEQGVGKPEEIPLPNDEQNLRLQGYDQQIKDLEAKLNTLTNQLLVSKAEWEKNTRSKLEAGQLAWRALKPIQFEAQNGSTLILKDDLSILASGANPDSETYTVTVATDLENITGVRLEALTDSSLDKNSLSRAGGNFILTDFRVEAMSGKAIELRMVKIGSATADHSQDGFPVSAAIDDKPDTGWAVNGHTKSENRKAAFIFEEPVSGGPGTVLKIKLAHAASYKKHHIGRFRIGVSTMDRPSYADRGLPDIVAQALTKTENDRSKKEHEAVTKFYLESAPAVTQLNGEIASIKKTKTDFLNSLPKTLATVTTEPRTMRILARGNWMDDSGAIVQPTVPEFLSSTSNSGDRASRIDLANWLISRDNPLTARVFVNRLWKMYFGTGLSRVLDDLGSQGEWPKHADLLDWLAVEFMDSGWDVKHVVRLIVTSNAYRQSSATREELKDRDPFNRLIARQSRFRLDSEMIRDNALALSGLLTTKLGGPSVKPYQPDDFWQHLNFPKRTYVHDQGLEQYRRGLYTFWCRTFPNPSMTTFDSPSREECTANRVTSNNPLQALVLLNDPTYVEAARSFAERVLRSCESDSRDERVKWAFKTALLRAPEAKEQQMLMGLLERELKHYASDTEAAAGLLNVGLKPLPKDLTASELAAWTSVCRVILNLHETISRY